MPILSGDTILESISIESRVESISEGIGMESMVESITEGMAMESIPESMMKSRVESRVIAESIMGMQRVHGTSFGGI